MEKIFKKMKKAGVIYVMEEAAKQGFYYGNSKWFNLGQGMPEVTQIIGAPDRITSIDIPFSNQGYAPVPGLKQLRENIANVYNEVFRENIENKFSYKNIAVCGGGRLAISRVISCLENTNVGYFIPDYASYEGILSIFRNINTFPIVLSEKNKFEIEFDELEKHIKTHNLKAILLSNPSNPTGNIINYSKLEKLLVLLKKYDITLIIDEFYFNYIYTKENKFLSISKLLKSIETDNVVIISGLTKAWRYPGWRIAWIIGDKNLIENVSTVGSFLDGGTSNPLQNAAINFVNKKNIEEESKAIRTLYNEKRLYMLKRLIKMNFIVNNNPEGAFYIWANIKNLNFENGMDFFKKALKENVIVVPGEFFDLNPNNKNKMKHCESYIRLSYSADYKVIKNGLDGLERLIEKNQ